MKVVRSNLSKSGIFKYIDWRPTEIGWYGERYRSRVRANADALEGDERRLQLLAFGERDSPFLKSSIDSVQFEVNKDCQNRPTRMRIEFMGRYDTEKMVLTYENVLVLETNCLDSMLLNVVVLGFELVREGNRLRQAFQFIHFDYAIIEAESIKFEWIPIADPE